MLSGVPPAATRCLVNHGEPKMIWELICIAVMLEETLLIRMFHLDIEGSRLGASKKAPYSIAALLSFRSWPVLWLMTDAMDAAMIRSQHFLPVGGLWGVAIAKPLRPGSFENLKVSKRFDGPTPQALQMLVWADRLSSAVWIDPLDVLRRKRWAARQSKLGYYLDSFQVTSMHWKSRSQLQLGTAWVGSKPFKTYTAIYIYIYTYIHIYIYIHYPFLGGCASIYQLFSRL